MRKQTLNSRIVQVKICKENHGVQLISLYILKLSIFSRQLLCNSWFFFIISLFALNSVFLLQISSSVTFIYFFSVRLKPMQNVIIKNQKNTWLEILFHLKKYRFLIVVRLDLVFLENWARM